MDSVYDVPYANITTLTGHVLPWTKEIKYLGIFILQCRVFKCAIGDPNNANVIFGKVGRLASEEVTLQLINQLIYGVVSCPLNKTQLSSLDFVMNRFLMKLFNTKNGNNYILTLKCRVLLWLGRLVFLDKLCHCDIY